MDKNKPLRVFEAKVLGKGGIGDYYSDHDHAVYPLSAAGNPFTAASIQSLFLLF